MNYYNSINSNNQKNQYLKSVVIPVEVLQRTTTNSIRKQNFDYYVKIKDKTNPNIQNTIKVCKKAFLTLHNIKDSRLRCKIFQNRDQTKDLRGLHEVKYNCIPLEVEQDIREFIENYPSRESHYSDSVKTGRKYVGSDKTIASLHREFIDIYQEYDDYVKYGFFRHIFKDCNVGFGYPRADICCSCEEFNVKLQEYKKLNKTENIEKQLKEM